jgi:hypothetical protein
MCGLCGMLGGEVHWLERRPAASGGDAAIPTHRAERLHRATLLNRVLQDYGLTLADWQGSSYMLSNRTGRTEIAANLMEIWKAAERMRGRRCDPLDPALLERLDASD